MSSFKDFLDELNHHANADILSFLSILLYGLYRIIIRALSSTIEIIGEKTKFIYTPKKSNDDR